MEEEYCHSMQLIDGNGKFNLERLENFTRTTEFTQRGLSYATVAIIGPQSSGKSTLMNHLFHTGFVEMDAGQGRTKTTKGIWIAKCSGTRHFTIAMDVEGTDGVERGEDDTAFERQSTLFALAVADVILINIWCNDMGREQAANRPLLRTVFQAIVRLFGARKVTLLFVIRDKTKKTPFEILKRYLKEDTEQLWAEVTKPEAHRSAPLGAFFKVEVIALSNYEHKEEQFKQEVAQLKKRFINSISPGGLAGDRRGVLPASLFSIHARNIWEIIKDDKHLDLPAIKVMVAKIKCEEIAKEKLEGFTSDREWLDLEIDVRDRPVPGFGRKLSSIMKKYLSQYDKETNYFEESGRNARREQLESRFLEVVYHAYDTMLKHLGSDTLESFKTSLARTLNEGKGFAASIRICEESAMLDFARRCEDATIRHGNDWDASKVGAEKVREKLLSDIRSYESSIHSAKLSEMKARYEKQLSDELKRGVVFKDDTRETWASIRHLLEHRTEAVVSEFSTAVAGFELERSTIDTMLQDLKKHARNVVARKAREESLSVVSRMKDRFIQVFNFVGPSTPRFWKSDQDIEGIKKNALFESLKILSTMAAMRLDEKADNIDNILFPSLLDGSTPNSTLASNTWDNVSPEAVLLSPKVCQTLWTQFLVDIEYVVRPAIFAQNERKEKAKARRNLKLIGEGMGLLLGISLGGTAMAFGIEPSSAVLAGQAISRAALAIIERIRDDDDQDARDADSSK